MSNAKESSREELEQKDSRLLSKERVHTTRTRTQDPLSSR